MTSSRIVKVTLCVKQRENRYDYPNLIKIADVIQGWSAYAIDTSRCYEAE